MSAAKETKPAAASTIAPLLLFTTSKKQPLNAAALGRADGVLDTIWDSTDCRQQGKQCRAERHE